MISRAGTLICSVLLGVCLIGCLGAAETMKLDDVIKLLQSGVGEQVIQASITQRGAAFSLSTADILALKKAGASDNLLVFMIGGSSTGEFPFEIENEFIVKKPTVFKHLAVYPVFKKTLEGIDDYLTLDQAQKARIIIIRERSDASVPTVIIRNTGRRPIYIMAGEIIVGGKQDRMVSFDILIPAHKEIEVEVRCVEHGRWTGKAEFKSGGALAGKSVRSALQFADQQDVWDEVAKSREKHGITSGSGTYDAVLSSGDIDRRSAPFLAAMKQGLADERMVGMIMALNGEVVCVDIFAGPKFFNEVREKLLKAYVLDAISAEEEVSRAPGKKEILSFFNEMKNARTQDSKKYDDNSNVELESELMIGNESRDKDGRLQHLNLNKK